MHWISEDEIRNNSGQCVELLSRALLLAGVTLAAAMFAGMLPMWRKVAEQENLLKWMTGVAAGVLLASALLVAIPEGFEISTGGTFGGLVAGGAVLAGFLAMLLFEASGFGHDIHEEHHDHEDDHGHSHVHHPSSARSIVIGLGLHALTDGLAIGAALATGSVVLTVSMFIAVLVHKIPAAFSVGVFCMHERGDRKKAMQDLTLFSLATPLMILLAFTLLGDIDESILGLAILFAGGTFLYVATVDVLPDVHHPQSGKQAFIHVVIGAAIMAALLYALDAFGLVSFA